MEGRQRMADGTDSSSPFIRWVILCSFLAPLSSAAGEPQIRDIDVRGFQVGETTTVTIFGSNLLPAPKLLSSVPIVKQDLQPDATAQRVQFAVTLDKATVPGVYNLWLATTDGLSKAHVIAVDHLPQRPFVDEVGELPISLHRAIGGNTRLRTAFTGKKDQAILIEVEAQRLGGKLRPVLHLLDANGKQLAWSLPTHTLHGDTRIETRLPADGKYTVELHDLQYAAAAPNHFRLKIGTWDYADLAFPLAVQRGKPASIELLGNVASNKRVELTSLSSQRQTAAPWLGGTASSGLRPRLAVSDTPELIEAEASDELQLLPPAPSAISGRLSEPGEMDQYSLAVKQGDKLRISVFADRVGSPLDAVLDVLNEQGGSLASNDDAGGTADPQLDYTVPAKIEKVTLRVRAVNGDGSPKHVYRVLVTRLDAKVADYQLSVTEERHAVAAGGRRILRVTATRGGYDGPIRLSFDKLPSGMQVQGGVIPAGANATLLTLHGSGAVSAQMLTSLRGTSEGGDPPLVRFAKRTHPLAQLQPWLENELAMAVAAPTAGGFDIDWQPLPADAKLVMGGKARLPLRAVRPVGFDGPVRLTLVNSQIPPLNNNKPIPNRTLRREAGKAVEIVADAAAQSKYDALLAATKVLTDAKSAVATATAAGAKAKKEAVARVEQMAAKKAAADKVATEAAAASKAANDAQAAATEKFAKALTQSKDDLLNSAKQVADARTLVEQLREANETENLLKAEVAAAAAVAAAAKMAASSAEVIQKLTAAKVAAAKKATDAAVRSKAATDAQAVADKALVDAKANMAAVEASTAKALADANAKAKQSAEALAAADNAAKLASATASNTTDFVMLVPADLPKLGYEFAFRAELLSRDKKSVVATSYTTVRHLLPLNPLAVKPTETKLESQLGEKGAMIRFAGKIERLADVKGDVTVSVGGLPKGLAVHNAMLKPDQSEYVLELNFPANFKAGAVNGIHLFATAKVEADSPVPVRSENIPIAINLLAATAPDDEDTPTN